MKKKITLWVKVCDGGRIVYTAGQKEWLSNFKLEYESPGVTYHDVELTGEYEVPDEKTET
jgi:hypothetical protein